MSPVVNSATIAHSHRSRPIFFLKNTSSTTNCGLPETFGTIFSWNQKAVELHEGVSTKATIGQTCKPSSPDVIFPKTVSSQGFFGRWDVSYILFHLQWKVLTQLIHIVSYAIDMPVKCTSYCFTCKQFMSGVS